MISMIFLSAVQHRNAILSWDGICSAMFLSLRDVVDVNFNIGLDWLRLEGANKFSILAKLSLAYLAVSASSAPSEKVWS